MEWTTLKKYISHISPTFMVDSYLAKLKWTVDACTKIMLEKMTTENQWPLLNFYAK
jgi:hypothetical protein